MYALLCLQKLSQQRASQASPNKLLGLWELVYAVEALAVFLTVKISQKARPTWVLFVKLLQLPALLHYCFFFIRDFVFYRTYFNLSFYQERIHIPVLSKYTISPCCARISKRNVKQGAIGIPLRRGEEKMSWVTLLIMAICTHEYSSRDFIIKRLLLSFITHKNNAPTESNYT